MGAVEMRFAEIIWEHEPVASGELVKLCEKELNWKKSTTYTVLRRLCQKGIFTSENGTVTSLMSRQMFQARQSEVIIEESFAGSCLLLWRRLPPGKSCLRKRSKN